MVKINRVAIKKRFVRDNVFLKSLSTASGLSAKNKILRKAKTKELDTLLWLSFLLINGKITVDKKLDQQLRNKRLATARLKNLFKDEDNDLKILLKKQKKDKRLILKKIITLLPLMITPLLRDELS